MAEKSELKHRILLLVPMLDQGGLERVCALTAQLLKTDYEVHLVVFNAAGMIYDVSGVHLIDLQMGAVPGRIGKLLNVWKRARKVRKLKRAFDIQISYSFGQTANLVNVLSKCHDTTWAGIRGYGALLERRRMQLVCKRADRMISCTKVMERELAASYPVRASAVLYNPCNLVQIQELASEAVDRQFEAFLAKPGKTVVSMGRAHDVKGFWHLLKCIYLIKESLPDSKLMIIGDGDYSEYRQLAADLQIEADVLFTGVQKNPFALLARADVYALTSDSEGFPNALIEAMACGLPCISVNCRTGPAEILQEDYTECENQDRLYMGDYGILTPVFHGGKNLDAASFAKEEKIYAEALKRLLTEEALYISYQKKVQERARDFCMEAYKIKLDELIMQDIKFGQK